MQRFQLLFMHPIIFFILPACFTARTQRSHSKISLGSSLSPIGNSSWRSPSGLYAFGFYDENNGVSYYVGVFPAGIPEKTVPVSSNATLLFNSNGRIVLLSTRQGQGSVIAHVSQPAYSASMLDSGSLVLCNSDGKMIWQTFEHPTDTLLPNQRLPVGMMLFPGISETNPSTGKFQLAVQSDGNLVQYANINPFI